MKRPRTELSLKRTTAAIALLFFIAASMLNGVCICSRLAATAKDGGQCIVSMDICGESASSAVYMSMDGVADTAVHIELYFPSRSLLPPQPGQAVASADPGETGKPPEA